MGGILEVLLANKSEVTTTITSGKVTAIAIAVTLPAVMVGVTSDLLARRTSRIPPILLAQSLAIPERV